MSTIAHVRAAEKAMKLAKAAFRDSNECPSRDELEQRRLAREAKQAADAYIKTILDFECDPVVAP